MKINNFEIFILQIQFMIYIKFINLLIRIYPLNPRKSVFYLFQTKKSRRKSTNPITAEYEINSEKIKVTPSPILSSSGFL